MAETLATLAWLVLLLPLLATAGIALFTLHDRRLSAGLSISAIVLSFILSCVLSGVLRDSNGAELRLNWLQVGALQVDLGLRLDALSLPMLLVVTGVGAVIHIFSVGYMHGDRGFSRYFAGLSLFTAAMTGIVLANNLVAMFIFWELVGVSSYLLIGFWYDRPAAADASKKAFLTNRIGDFGFLLGILLVWSLLGSLRFAELEEILRANPGALGAWATAAGLLIFCGAVGKSAQFPLHVWLPDAMEGPTPVSALIHAATMVAAGVYMLCRTFFLFNASALQVVAWIGGITALLAAVIAVQQNDIKRVLAYSTLSQLGYMVMAVGVGGPVAALCHLTTHAFFKALLFLAAGSIIHSLHHEQDIWNMGGLRSRMPLTFWTFLIGAMALAGVPPLSGFYSKDAVLAAAYHNSVALFSVGVLVAILTTFYMVRLLLVVFWGDNRSPAAGHALESPGVMTLPLLVLAVPSCLAGFWGIAAAYGRKFGAAEPAGAPSLMGQLLAPFSHEPVAALASLAAVGAGLLLAWPLYARAQRDPLTGKLGVLARAMRHRFYFDELYGALISLTQERLAFIASAIDRWIVAGFLVRGVHSMTELGGRLLRLVQTGNLQTYAFLFTAGLALLLFFMLR